MAAGKRLTHGSNTDQWCTDTSVQPPPHSIPCNALLHHVDRSLVHPALSGLKPNLDKIERMTDDHGADATKAACCEGAQLGKARRGGGLGVSLELLLGGRDGGLDLLFEVVGGHCESLRLSGFWSELRGGRRGNGHARPMTECLWLECLRSLPASESVFVDRAQETAKEERLSQ